MYRPVFNKVLVKIDDKDARWGKSPDEGLGGQVYREGTLLECGIFVRTRDYEIPLVVEPLVGKKIMWHEGHEAGTVFEDGSEKYALIYWWDIIGEKK